MKVYPLVLSTLVALQKWQEGEAIYSHFPQCTAFLTDNEKNHGPPLIEVIPNAFDASTLAEVKESLQIPRFEAEVYDGRFLSNVRVGNRVVQKFTKLLGVGPFSDSEYLPSVSIEESTALHVDCKYSWDGVEEIGRCGDHLGPPDRVGYIFMNDNPDAHFNHGDVTVPVKAGTFVSFRGDIPHNTVVNKGSVTLLGPLEPSCDGLGEPRKGHVWGSDAVCEEGELCCNPVVDEPGRALKELVPTKRNLPDVEDYEGCFVEGNGWACDDWDGECTEFTSVFGASTATKSKTPKSRRNLGGSSYKKAKSSCSGPGGHCETPLDCCLETCAAEIVNCGRALVVCSQNECGCDVFTGEECN